MMGFKVKELSRQYCQYCQSGGRWRRWIKGTGVSTVVWMSLATGLSIQTPAQAQMPVRDQPAQDPKDEQAQTRIAKLRRLQAGIAPSERGFQLNQSHYAQPTAVVLANGVYLYGQQPVRDQLAAVYLILAAHNGEVVGAFYMPSSSFDCVQGEIDAEKLALTVMDSYLQETAPYALTLNAPAADVATREGAIAPPPNIDGFYPLSVNDRDLELLAICQARVAN